MVVPFCLLLISSVSLSFLTRLRFHKYVAIWKKATTADQRFHLLHTPRWQACLCSSETNLQGPPCIIPWSHIRRNNEWVNRRCQSQRDSMHEYAYDILYCSHCLTHCQRWYTMHNVNINCTIIETQSFKEKRPFVYLRISLIFDNILIKAIVNHTHNRINQKETD